MSDLDSYRTQQDAHRGRTAQAVPTRNSEAINRYLGATGYRLDEPDLPATTADRPVPPAATTTGVLVGVDDTPTSYTAVDHAAIEAELRGWDLRIVHVQHPGGLRPSSRDAGARLLERLTDRVHAYSPSVPVTSTTVPSWSYGCLGGRRGRSSAAVRSSWAPTARRARPSGSPWRRPAYAAAIW